MPIRVVTDSTCDLSQAELDRYGIEAVPVYVNIDGKSYRDGVDLPRDAFYQRLPRLGARVRTSSPGPGVFVETYKRLAREGATGIVSLHLSSELSNVCQVAQLAARETPSVPVRVLDSGNVSLATGLAAIEAAEQAASGASLDEIAHSVDDYARHCHCFAVLDSVEYLRRSGRVSQIMSVLASLVQIKPLIGFASGAVSIERVRTLKGAMHRLLDKVGLLGRLRRLTILHTDALERAESFHRLVSELVAPDALSPQPVLVTPVLGVHLGPNAVGFAAVTHNGVQPTEESPRAGA